MDLPAVNQYYQANGCAQFGSPLDSVVLSSVVCRTARERFSSQRFAQEFKRLDGATLVSDRGTSVRELREYQVDGINWLRERWWRQQSCSTSCTSWTVFVKLLRVYTHLMPCCALYDALAYDSPRR
jgi:hypothetical protein|eukprot:COSAG02_NODE_1408_length_12764_cov_254.164627_3_plen_126_part_00